MKKLILTTTCICSLTAIGQNIAPPVPINTPVENGNTMRTDVNIGVNEDIDKVVVKHTSARPKLITKTYELKEGDPSTIKAIIKGAVNGTRDRSQVGDIRVESIRYKGQDITGVLVITAPEDRFENSVNGSIPISKLVKMLDKPLMLDLDARFHLQVYVAKYKPAHELKELLERFILHTPPAIALLTADPKDIAAAGGVDAYLLSKQRDNQVETKFGRDFVLVDKELNQLLIASASGEADDVREFLEQQDRPYSNLHVKMTIYEIANKNSLELGNDFNAWKNANATSFVNIADHGKNITLKAELDAQYFDFLARKGKAKIYSSMDMLLKPNKTSTFDQRKLFFTTLPKNVTITPEPTANGQVPVKTETKVPYSYGTSLNITPYKQGNYTKLEISIENISLVGFNDDGTAQTATSSLDSELVVKNEGTEYVAGYLSRKEVIKSVTKVPIIGSIPFIGYLFSTEADQTRTNQLVIVLSCNEQSYDAASIDSGSNDINEVKETVKESESDPKPGYDQLKFN